MGFTRPFQNFFRTNSANSQGFLKIWGLLKLYVLTCEVNRIHNVNTQGGTTEKS
jgi:hypothetical protein